MQLWKQSAVLALFLPVTATGCDPEAEPLPDEDDLVERGNYVVTTRTSWRTIRHRQPTNGYLDECIQLDPDSMTEDPQSWPEFFLNHGFQILVPDAEKGWFDVFLQEDGDPDEACEDACGNQGYVFRGAWYLDLDVVAFEPPELKLYCPYDYFKGEVAVETSGSVACECRSWKPTWQPTWQPALRPFW